MGTAKLRRHLKKTIVGLVIAAAAAIAILLAVYVLTHEIAGAHPPPPVFEYDEAFTIEKSTSEGAEYTVNNSVATFELDVAAADSHCRKLFRDYASAMAYCKSESLPLLPSVQLVQEKCKQFDDGLCAALELAVQKGLAGKELLGKQAALEGFAKRLADLLAEAPPDRRGPVEKALVHVATALELGGVKLDLPPGIAVTVAASRREFLARPACSRPVGFWTWSEELRCLFMQDRFLSKGLRLPEETATAIVLSVALSKDDRLASAFRRFNGLDAKLTNPLTYVEPGETFAPQAKLVVFDEVNALLPEGISLADALAGEFVAKVADDLKGRFGAEAGFALVAYSESKEYGLLQRLGREGKLAGATMELIIDAVKSGRLSLEPKPDSGWYDYQWHALETLLLPERARESAKLKLTDAYKERLRNAFRAILTKQRETHIKHLPMLTLGMALGEPEPPPIVEIGPEFSVEPTATVYLRSARGYRFLRNALHAVLGEDALEGLHRRNADLPAVDIDLDTELRESALRLYGFYERLCLEAGLRPQYLEGEISVEGIEEAKAIAARWLASLREDRDLAGDTRVAVPISYYPGGPTRHWATGGVRLERVEYEYREKPKVTGRIEAVFVPTYYYAPTDIFLEFDRPGEAPLTRDEFRAICDGAEDEESLREALGAIEAKPRRGRFPYVTIILLAALVSVGVLAYRFRAKLPRVKFKRFLTRRDYWIAGASLGAILLVWVLALILFPSYRVRFLVKHVARLNTNLGVICENRFVPAVHPRHRMKALVGLLDDPDPQVRYLAARFIVTTGWEDDYRHGTEESYLSGEVAEAKLRTVAKDEVPAIAQYGIEALGAFKSPENVDFLLAKLMDNRHIDALCASAISSLGQIGDARALDDVLPFTRDPRRLVRMRAIWSLGRYGDPRAAERAIELVQSADDVTGRSARRAIYSLREGLAEASWTIRFDEALLAATRNAASSPRHRSQCAEQIADPGLRARACLSILLSPGPDEPGWSASQCRAEAARSLGRIGPEAAVAVPALRRALQDPDARARKAATEALKKIEPKE
jgi:HEAT repeat protein